MDSTVLSPPPTYLCFYHVTCNVHDLIVPENNKQKGLTFLETQNQSLNIRNYTQVFSRSRPLWYLKLYNKNIKQFY